MSDSQEFDQLAARALAFVREQQQALAAFGKEDPTSPGIRDRFRRWHGETLRGLADNVSAAEATEFQPLGNLVGPYAVDWSDETSDQRFYRVASEFLEALRKDLEEAPRRVIVPTAPKPEPPKAKAGRAMVRLFLCHSSEDEAIAGQLVTLFRLALGLDQREIRCTSVNGYKLDGGADIDDQLRAEAFGADTFVGIISKASIASLYVIFELGARWGADKEIVPLLAPGMSKSSLPGPLGGKNALHMVNPAEMHQLLSNLGNRLGLQPKPPEAYVDLVQALAATPTPGATPTASSAAGPARLLELRDTLVSLRDRGVHEILNAEGLTLDRWILEQELWRDEVIAALRPWKLVHRFDPLVFIEENPIARSIGDPEHRKQLNMLAMRLERLGRLIEETERAIPFQILVSNPAPKT